MHAIETKYLGPTVKKGGRIKVMGMENSITVEWDYAITIHENYEAAILSLVEKINASRGFNRFEVKAYGVPPSGKGLTAIIG